MRLSRRTFANVALVAGVGIVTGWLVLDREGDDGKVETLSAATKDVPSHAFITASQPQSADVRAAGQSGATPSHSTPANSSPSTAPRIALRPPSGASAADAEWRRSLVPRTPLAKEPLVSPPGQVHKLTLKLSDHLEARPGPSGELLVTADRPDDVAELARVAEEWSLRFRPVQTATDDALRKLQDRAARRTGRAQPDLGGIVEAVLPEATPERVLAAAAALHALPQVEFAEIKSIDAPPPPPGDISPPTPSLVANQGYRQAASGVDVDYVWNTYGIRGAAALKVLDCEYQFRPTHEDLAGLVTIQPGIESMYAGFGDDHGTAVMGIIGAGDNGYGMNGSVPWCELYFYPEFAIRAGNGTTQDRTATVVAAVADAGVGDIVMLEMQDTGGNGSYGPAEYVPSVWTAVKAGTDAGVIIVAAAGNGSENMDSAQYQAYRNRGDSGAIIVGAADAERARLSYSTYGARVDVQGWGTGAASTGYGHLVTYGGDANQKYTGSFSGTSAATPIVVSAVALLQSVAIEILQRRLDPQEVRSLLVVTGRGQTGDLSKRIGPLPDLKKATEALFAAEQPTFSTLRSWGFANLATGNPDWSDDPDGDGANNLLEYVIGSDPNDGSAADLTGHPRVYSVPGPRGRRATRFVFTNPAGRVGAVWAVESNTSLEAPDWQPLQNGVGGVSISRTGDTVLVQIIESPQSSRRFLRLRATAP